MNTARNAIAVLLLAGLTAACSQSAREAGTTLTTADGVAIGGYDTVAYFTLGTPTRGSAEFNAQHNGTTWWFASAEHRNLFAADPERYAPAYGGWCAYGMAEGYAAETDPVDGWTIHDGRLYLNWDAEISSQWNADRASFLELSEANWPGVEGELSAGEATVYWHE
ncbi:MAG: YHS domain-containing (seleno)protein [Pseudomonadota bacterium]